MKVCKDPEKEAEEMRIHHWTRYASLPWLQRRGFHCWVWSRRCRIGNGMLAITRNFGIPWMVRASTCNFILEYLLASRVNDNYRLKFKSVHLERFHSLCNEWFQNPRHPHEKDKGYSESPASISNIRKNDRLSGYMVEFSFISAGLRFLRALISHW